MNTKILIVDDSATARKLFKICVQENNGYEVIEANNWQSAIDLARLHAPFLIILDYNMPEKSGGEIARLMQALDINARFVLLTANTQQSIIDEVTDLGFFDVIEKPVTPENIHDLLEKLK